MNAEEATLYWDQRKHQLTVPLGASDNVATFHMAPGFDKFEAFSTEIGRREPHRYGCGSGQRRHSRDGRQQLRNKGVGGDLRGRYTIHIDQPGRTHECTGKGNTFLGSKRRGGPSADKRRSRITEAAPPLRPHFVQAGTGDGEARHGPNAACQMPHPSVDRVYVRQNDQTEVARQNRTGGRRSRKSFETWPGHRSTKCSHQHRASSRR